MTKIIVDSTCDLETALFKDVVPEVLPLTITLGDKNYLDGEEITVDEVYAHMRRGVIPKTAQIPYEKICGLFRRCCEAGEDFIYLAFSGEMSGSFAFAKTIAETLQEAFPDRHMAVVDSRGGSSATGLIALQAVRYAKRGLAFEDILKKLQGLIDHVQHVFSVADLEWMAKGGRIAKPMGYIGAKLSIRPILDVQEGKMVVIKMVRGNKKALHTVADLVAERAKAFPKQLIAITHADDLPAAKEMEGLLKVRLPECATTICQIGGVLGVHIGIGGVGVFFFDQDCGCIS